MVPLRHAQQAAAAIPHSELVTAPVGMTSSFDRTTSHQKWRRFFKRQWQQLPDFFADGGTSLAGLAVKKPWGLRVKPM